MLIEKGDIKLNSWIFRLAKKQIWTIIPNRIRFIDKIKATRPSRKTLFLTKRVGKRMIVYSIHLDIWVKI